MPGPNGVPGAMSGRRCGDARLAARARRLVQVDARGDRSDRRQVDVIPGVGEHMVGWDKWRAAGASLGVDVARRVRVFAQGARNATLEPFRLGILDAFWKLR
jgi:hypothetical protein